MERQIMPWNIKIGMKAAFGSRASKDYINRYRVLTVVQVTKVKAVMCAGYKWQVLFDNGEKWHYYGKTTSLPPQKFSQLVD